MQSNYENTENLPFEDDNTTYSVEDYTPRESNAEVHDNDDSYSFFPDFGF